MQPKYDNESVKYNLYERRKASAVACINTLSSKKKKKTIFFCFITLLQDMAF